MSKITDLGIDQIYRLRHNLKGYSQSIKFFVQFFENAPENSKMKINSLKELKNIRSYIPTLKNLLNEIDRLVELELTFKRDEDDDHTSVWGGAGPDCITGRLEAA
jgi:hypothetical protein